MTNFYRVMLGRKSVFLDECVSGGYVGADFDIHEDLTSHLTEDMREFSNRFIPVLMDETPGKTKISAGLACGMLWTICKGLNEGDVILSPTGSGMYHVGTVRSDYHYAPGQALPHRREVAWSDKLIARNDMSDALKRSAGSIATVANISRFEDELLGLIGTISRSLVSVVDESVEDASTFALEKHLEDFLVANWASTALGKTHDIYEEDGEIKGQQYPTDTGPIDVLAISKDGRELLVVELKRGRASDTVVGQVQRYMGYVLDQLAEPGQQVRGAIIALDDDIKIRRALLVAPNIDFYRYQVTFRLDRA